MAPPDQQKIPAISWSWNEGRYWDLWMIVHLLSGMICGALIVWLGLPSLYAYPVALIALAGWELAEMSYGVKEEPENWLLDIVFGMLGFWFVYEKVLPGESGYQAFGTALVLLFFNGFFALLGWRAYRKRSRTA